MTLALTDRPEWHRLAACRDVDVEFFPDSSFDSGPAKAVCATCPVAGPCLAYALTLPTISDHGVWGGTTARERRRIRSERARARRAAS